MSTETDDMARIDKALQELGEHFDSVQIFATRHDPEIEDGTVSCKKGCGNWFARYGQVKEWILRVEEETRISARKDE